MIHPGYREICLREPVIRIRFRIMLRSVGLFAAVGIALSLAACSSSSLPKVYVAKVEASAPGKEGMHQERLAEALSEAEAAAPNKETAAYNKAVESFVMELQRCVSPRHWREPMLITGRHGKWAVSFDDRPVEQQGRPEWSPSWFDSLTPSSRFNLDRYEEHVSGQGVGVPMVLTLENAKVIRTELRFRPNNGLYVPGTAVLEFGRPATRGGATSVRLHFYNTCDRRVVKHCGVTQPMAYDLTSAVEANLDNHYVRENGLLGFFRLDRRQDDIGLFGLDVYDPGKIPVVFVHGLNSSPRIWAGAVNAILADPKLNARYQPLLFIYPTGMPVPAAAGKFRQSLMNFRNTWDPDGNDAGFNRMIVIGHSMGGLLTRLQVIDSGERLRQAFFTRDISEIAWLTAEQKKEAQAALVVKPLPFVTRAVFIATPHRGSKIADTGIARFLVRLIKLPANVTTTLTRALTEGLDAINPALLNYNSLGLSSVDMLSPEHPYFKALEDCKITVPFHSIIGDRGKGTGPESSDGAVPYWSSHLDGAQSEKIVPYGHSCTMKRETVAEVLRILRLHAGR